MKDLKINAKNIEKLRKLAKASSGYELFKDITKTFNETDHTTETSIDDNKFTYNENAIKDDFIVKYSSSIDFKGSPRFLNSEITFIEDGKEDSGGYFVEPIKYIKSKVK